jgi:hypothetical protein
MLACSNCATPLAMNTTGLLRAGRLTDACRAAFYGTEGDRAAVAAQVRSLAPLRVRVHVLSGPGDPEWPPPAPPTLANGHLATWYVEHPAAPPGAPTIVRTVSTPTLETLEERDIARQTSALLTGEVSEGLAYWMVTGSSLPGTGDTPGILLDGVALLLSAGLVDPHLRERQTPTPTRSPLPAPVAELHARFAGQRPARVCETAAGAGCARPLALLPNPSDRVPERLVFEVSWWLVENDCRERRVVALPLPPGADLAARINAAFAAGPVDLSSAPTLDR